MWQSTCVCWEHTSNGYHTFRVLVCVFVCHALPATWQIEPILTINKNICMLSTVEGIWRRKKKIQKKHCLHTRGMKCGSKLICAPRNDNVMCHICDRATRDGMQMNEMISCVCVRSIDDVNRLFLPYALCAFHRCMPKSTGEMVIIIMRRPVTNINGNHV